MTNGTFNVSRRIWSHPVFAPSEYSEREAFLWLVSEASWKPRTVRAGRLVVDLERGQLCASVRFMAEAWNWSKSRVDRFLKRLQTHEMIRTESGTGQLVVTVCNYDEYQGKRDTDGTEAGQKRDTSGTNYKKDEIRKEGNIRDTNVSLGQNAFDDFWQVYPRKTVKSAARKAYAKAVKKASHDDIMFGLSQHLPALQAKEKQFIPHPATWLNQERWSDEPEQPDNRINGNDARAHRPGAGMAQAFASVAERLSRNPQEGGGGGDGFI